MSAFESTLLPPQCGRHKWKPPNFGCCFGMRGIMTMPNANKDTSFNNGIGCCEEALFLILHQQSRIGQEDGGRSEKRVLATSPYH